MRTTCAFVGISNSYARMCAGLNSNILKCIQYHEHYSLYNGLNGPIQLDSVYKVLHITASRAPEWSMDHICFKRVLMQKRYLLRCRAFF